MMEIVTCESPDRLTQSEVLQALHIADQTTDPNVKRLALNLAERALAPPLMVALSDEMKRDFRNER